MSGLFHKFVQIALLRAGPQELPGLSMVLWIAIGSVFITSLAGLLFAYPFVDALIRCLAAIAIPAAILYGALHIKRTPSRFTQCYAAICGASAVVYVLALPIDANVFQRDCQYAGWQTGRGDNFVARCMDVINHCTHF